eukprot:GHRR01006412.1.p1 GENE.GHRR01006412.1~~GHRR01006412.1.p1  ORF type:complete len:608 (+),score=207.09 GHRR01006412.1:162-1985(+)
MSSTAVLGFIKDITAKKVKEVEQRLKKEKPNQRYTDPAQQGTTYTLLHKAVAVGSPEIVVALLKAGADINATDSKGKTSLHWLAGVSDELHMKIAELLLKRKSIDIQAGSNSSATPLHEAAAQGNTKLTKLLLAKGANPSGVSGSSPVHSACQAAQGAACMVVVEQLLQQAPDLLGRQDSAGFTPLMRLLQRGLWSEAKQLLDKGDCNVNARGPKGDTALLLACSNPAPDIVIVSALLAAGADASVQEASSGFTPLMMAVKLGGEQGLALAQLLLQNIQKQRQAARLRSDHGWVASNNGETAGSTECASGGVGNSGNTRDKNNQVRSSSSDEHNYGGLNAKSAANETAVTLAAAAAEAAARATSAGGSGRDAAVNIAAGRPELTKNWEVAMRMLEVLLSHQPDVPEDLIGRLLQQGLSGRLSDAITAQLVLLAPLAAINNSASAAGLTLPLSFTGMLGLKLCRTAVAVMVKSSGKDLRESQDAADNTHLHLAACSREDLPDLVAALLSVGVPANAVNNDGDTALHLAARAGHIGVCRALVEGGADVFRRNNKSRTPGTQLKLSQQTRDYLKTAEEAAKAAKEERFHELWDAKMRATQTASAFGIRVT